MINLDKLYLTQTKYKTYQYKRRVPKVLLDFINTVTIRQTVGSNQDEAIVKAVSFNSALQDALQLIEMGVTETIIYDKLSIFNSTSIIKKSIKEEKQPKRLKNIAEEFIKSKDGLISTHELNSYKYVFKEVVASTFKYISKE
ncbi:MAG: hypothetical protein U9R50_04080 [Campylobacterota bacterium]|nr:hypothetical protein [Campylobacterota bacterium]